MSGPNALTYSDIKAWKDLTNTPVSAREVEVIKRLDVAYLGVANG
jgi:hypothetical protein|tara:strand:- start:215 stop:349 length:135 start_codon:yes stop_codon:yes gene_type:complete